MFSYGKRNVRQFISSALLLLPYCIYRRQSSMHKPSLVNYRLLWVNRQDLNVEWTIKPLHNKFIDLFSKLSQIIKAILHTSILLVTHSQLSNLLLQSSRLRFSIPHRVLQLCHILHLLVQSLLIRFVPSI